MDKLGNTAMQGGSVGETAAEEKTGERLKAGREKRSDRDSVSLRQSITLSFESEMNQQHSGEKEISYASVPR